MIAIVLSALTELKRLEAMRRLADGSEHCVCALMRKPEEVQSQMSRQMQILNQRALVADRRDAQWVRYRINPDLSPPMLRFVAAVLERDLAIGMVAA